MPAMFYLSWPHLSSGNMSAGHEAFNSIETDLSGSIGTGELANLLKDMGTRATIEELEEMVRF